MKMKFDPKKYESQFNIAKMQISNEQQKQRQLKFLQKIKNIINLVKNECMHNKVINIYYTVGFDGRFYDGYCTKCERVVYARTGKKNIPWNTDRNKTFED